MEKNHQYKLIALTKGKWVHARSFNSYDELILFLARGQKDKKDWYMNWDGHFSTYHNVYLDNLNMNYKDNYYFSSWKERVAEYRTREYIFLRDDDTIVDVRLFHKDVLKKWNEIGRNPYWGYRWKRHNHPYEFRKDPVPGVHKSHGSYGRSAKVGRLIKMVDHPEYKEYNRHIDRYEKKAYGWWDAPSTHSDRSWKTSYKCRKQWQKHLD